VVVVFAIAGRAACAGGAPARLSWNCARDCEPIEW